MSAPRKGERCLSWRPPFRNVLIPTQVLVDLHQLLDTVQGLWVVTGRTGGARRLGRVLCAIIDTQPQRHSDRVVVVFAGSKQIRLLTGSDEFLELAAVNGFGVGKLSFNRGPLRC